MTPVAIGNGILSGMRMVGATYSNDNNVKYDDDGKPSESLHKQTLEL